MINVYYKKSTGYLCYRHPTNYEPESENDFIEVSEEDYEKTLQCDYGKAWAVIDGKLEIVEDKNITGTKDYKISVCDNEIASLQAYLSSTDYVISKLNELKLEDDDEYEAEKAKYSDVLKKRRDARSRINSIQKKIDDLKAS